MICAWTEFLSILPEWLRKPLYRSENTLQELRLRIGQVPEWIPHFERFPLQKKISSEDLLFCINAASRYSPWNAASMKKGYLTGPGGHRIGVCGTLHYQDGKCSGIRDITSLCIRVARDVPGVADKIAGIKDSVLIIGAPGWGKTTLLRDLIRQRSNLGQHVCVADERNELFPQGHFLPGRCTDILSGCLKSDGIEMLMRTMGPDCIAVDEITATEDCSAILHAAYCGVSLIATAHASSIDDFYQRSIYVPLINSNIFNTIIVLHKDKSWHMERGSKCCTNGLAHVSSS